MKFSTLLFFEDGDTTQLPMSEEEENSFKPRRKQPNNKALRELSGFGISLSVWLADWLIDRSIIMWDSIKKERQIEQTFWLLGVRSYK